MTGSDTNKNSKIEDKKDDRIIKLMNTMKEDGINNKTNEDSSFSEVFVQISYYIELWISVALSYK